MNSRKIWAARIIMTVLTAAAIAFIFYNSSLDAVESTEQSTPLTEWINSITEKLPIPFTLTENIVRKLAHFAEYTLLGTLLTSTVYLYCRKRSKTLLISVPIGAVVASCDETIQLFSLGRSAELRDVLIDCCGVVFAALIVCLFLLIKEKVKEKRHGRKVEP